MKFSEEKWSQTSAISERQNFDTTILVHPTLLAISKNEPHTKLGEIFILFTFITRYKNKALEHYVKVIQ